MAPIRSPAKKKEEDEKPYSTKPTSPYKGTSPAGYTPAFDAVLLKALDNFIKTGIYQAVKDDPEVKAKFNGSPGASYAVKTRLAALIKQRKA